MLDVAITGGEVIDGTGAPRRRADVGIKDGAIVAIGELDDAAAQVVDAQGQVVAPGFVDIHTHYDAQLGWDPTASPSPLHGVTTVVGGNCGFSIAPLSPDAGDYLMRMLARVEGMPLESLQAGLGWDWSSFGEWLGTMDGGIAVNAGFLVGHSALRRVVMGDDAASSPASPDQVRAMGELLGRSLDEGGLGFSSSWARTHNDGDGNPVPSRAATADELLALCAVVRDHPGTTLEFIPEAGGFDQDHVELMTAMSATAQRPLNWNVLPAIAGMEEWAQGLLAASDHAAANGGRVVALSVPDVMHMRLNLRSGFIWDTLPGWAPIMTLPLDEKLQVIADPFDRQRLAEAAARDTGMGAFFANWPALRIAETFSDQNRGLAGRTVGEVAAERGVDPFDALCDIALADGLRTQFMPDMPGGDDASWKYRAELWRDPRVVVGASDAGAHLDMIHTFTYSTSMLAEARDRELMGLEEVVHRLTDVQARLYGLRGRGRLAEGWRADLVVFDPATIGPGPVETRFDLPGGEARLYAEAEGISHVLVNGDEIVRDGSFTGSTPGTVLHSGRDTETVTP